MAAPLAWVPPRTGAADDDIRHLPFIVPTDSRNLPTAGSTWLLASIGPSTDATVTDRPDARLTRLAATLLGTPFAFVTKMGRIQLQFHPASSEPTDRAAVYPELAVPAQVVRPSMTLVVLTRRTPSTGPVTFIAGQTRTGSVEAPISVVWRATMDRFTSHTRWLVSAFTA
jgi:hypothetical protein